MAITKKEYAVYINCASLKSIVATNISWELNPYVSIWNTKDIEELKWNSVQDNIMQIVQEHRLENRL